MKKIVFTIISIFISVNFVFSVPAKSFVIRILQNNGTEISIKQNGDEHFHFTTTEDGFLIKENSNGIFEYAEINNDGEILTTGILAKNSQIRTKSEQNFIEKIASEKNIFDLAKNISKTRVEKNFSVLKSGSAENSTAAIGSRFPVILVNFSNKAFVTPDANSAFNNMLNQENYNQNNAIGSARDYFINSSNSLYQPVFDVFGPYNLPQNMNYYGANDSYGDDMRAEQMIKDACALASADINFSLYDGDGDGKVDNVFVIFAGYNEAENGGANTIWPHYFFLYSSPPSYNGKTIYSYICTSELKNNSGNKMAGIGTFCHEFGHALGLPDLYNTSSGSTVLHSWDIMDMGCYNGPGNNGDVPCLYSAFEMFYMGWLTPEVLKENYTQTSIENKKNAFLISNSKTHNLNGKNPNPTNFYILENRQKKGFDAYLPGNGLLIWKINYKSSDWGLPNRVNVSPRGVDIVRANNSQTAGALAGWSFPGTSNVTSYNFSEWSQSISDILENDEIVTFKYGGNSYSLYFEPNFLISSKLFENEKYDLNIINSTLNWSVSMNYGKYLLEVFSINGALLKTFNFETELKVQKNDFPNGVYLLKIKDLNKNKIYFSKVIK
jgi:M6 family metalloprotease-like protein